MENKQLENPSAESFKDFKFKSSYIIDNCTSYIITKDAFPNSEEVILRLSDFTQGEELIVYAGKTKESSSSLENKSMFGRFIYGDIVFDERGGVIGAEKGIVIPVIWNDIKDYNAISIENPACSMKKGKIDLYVKHKVI